MTRIYLIRHAEAEGNWFRRIQGFYDGQITPRGKKQISALAERFRDVELDALYSSDLSRTVETSGAITRYHDLPIITDKRLRELGMGIWENKAWGDMTYEQPEQMRYFSSSPTKWNVAGCESFDHLAQRITGAVRDIASRHDGQTIAIVSHGTAIRSLLCALLGLPQERITEVPHGDNTAVALLEAQDGHMDIIYMNDNSHVPPELSTFSKQTWWKTASGTEDNNLRFSSMDPSAEKELYLRLYESSWIAAHGSTGGFDPDYYLRQAMLHFREDNRCIMKACAGDKCVGIIEMNINEGRRNGFGWISLLCIDPDFRGNGFGVQLIGHADAFFGELGREKLGLVTAAENAKAIGFYEYCGFRKCGVRPGTLGTLYVMERPILRRIPE